MSRVKKAFIAGATLLSLEFLCLGFFNSGSFAWSTSYLTARPTRVSAGARPVLAEWRAKGLDGSIAADDSEAAWPGLVATTSRRGQVLVRYLAVPFRFSHILIPNISRYIFKSVFIL